MRAVISPETAANVLFFFGRGGFEAGTFTTRLMSAAGHADQDNLDRLAAGFPELIAAMRLAMQDPTGIEQLTEIYRKGFES